MLAREVCVWLAWFLRHKKSDFEAGFLEGSKAEVLVEVKQQPDLED